MQQTESPHPQKTNTTKGWLRKISTLSLPLLLGQLLSKGLNFVAFFLITRALGLEGFGIWVWAFSLTAMASACWSFGLQVWLSKATARLSPKLDGLPNLLRKTFFIRLAALLTVICVGAVVFQFIGFPNNINIDIYTLRVTLLALLAGFVFRTTSELFGAVMRGQLLTWPDGLALFLARLSFVLLLVWRHTNGQLTLQGVGYCFCLSEALAALVNGGIFFISIKSAWQNNIAPLQTSILSWKPLLHEVSLYGGLLMASAFLFRIGMLFSGQQLNATDIGTFAVLHRLNEFSLFLPEALAAVLLPFWTQSKPTSGLKETCTVAALMALCGFIMGGGYMQRVPGYCPTSFKTHISWFCPGCGS